MKRRALLPLALLLLGTAILPPTVTAGGGTATVDHADFDELLHRYVNGSGVRYAAWAASDDDRHRLETYLERMAAVAVSGLDRDERLAYWINLYNALTLNLVLGDYPVKSIKKISGLRSPWKRELVTVEGRDLTLNGIENDVIRPEFGEPRIHFALNCAAISCPPLRGEAYAAAELDQQLEEQARTFLSDPDHNGFDSDGTLRVSKILEWYREDFEKSGDLGEWLSAFIPELADRQEPAKIRFHGYDWDLNEAK